MTDTKTPTLTARRAAGDGAEQRALDYLSAQGLRLIARNVQCKAGEIDLILQDNQAIVFVEVRLRSSGHFGGALSSVTFAKIAKLKRAAQWYLLQQYGRQTWPACRFDVIAWEGAKLTWIKNAFDN